MRDTLLRLSLRAAVQEILATVEQRLRAELEGERVELREVIGEADHCYRLCVNGRGVGDTISVQDVVGDAVVRGVRPAEERLFRELSDRVMMHLQTV